MWTILENILCALEKVYSSAFGWNVLKISMRSIPSNMSFKTHVSLLIFSFDDLYIGVSGVLKSPPIMVLLSISPFMSVSVCREKSSRKTSISVLLTMPKPLTVWITINCGKFFKRWESRPADLPLEKPICRSGSNS